LGRGLALVDLSAGELPHPAVPLVRLLGKRRVPPGAPPFTSFRLTVTFAG
jgi:hypothetical protein